LLLTCFDRTKLPSLAFMANVSKQAGIILTCSESWGFRCVGPAIPLLMLDNMGEEIVK
jgi:hypothetical protein